MRNGCVRKMITKEIIEKINKLTYEKDGDKFIDLQNSRLDFSQGYKIIILKEGLKSVVLGEELGCDTYQRKLAKIYTRENDDIILYVDEFRYSIKL